MQFAVDNPKFDDTKCQLFASCFLYILNCNDQNMINKNELAVRFPYINRNLESLESDIVRINNYFNRYGANKFTCASYSKYGIMLTCYLCSTQQS